MAEMWDKGTVLLSHFQPDYRLKPSNGLAKKWDRRTVPMSQKNLPLVFPPVFVCDN